MEILKAELIEVGFESYSNSEEALSLDETLKMYIELMENGQI